MKNSLLSVLAWPIAVCTVTGCGQLGKLHEMTDRMERRTEEMNLRTAILQREQRQGVSQQVRRDALELISQRNRPIELKFKDAAVYFQAFEFQLWENILDDDEDIRQTLLATGAEEFMISFRGIIDGKRKKPNPLSKNDKMTSLLALAATVEQINDLQRHASVREGSEFELVSMIDLIVNALKMKREIFENPGIEVPAYVEKVLFFEDEAKYLLQLRENILIAMVVDKLSDASQASLWKKLGLLLVALKLKGSWETDLVNFNASEIKRLNQLLVDARFAHHAIKMAGETPFLNSKIAALFARMRVRSDDWGGTQKDEATQEFLATIQFLRCDLGMVKVSDPNECYH